MHCMQYCSHRSSLVIDDVHWLCVWQGKWTARQIPNPDFFEDLEPYKMTPIVSYLIVFCVTLMTFCIKVKCFE